MYMPPSAPFRRRSLVSQRLAILPARLCCLSAAIRTFLVFPCLGGFFVKFPVPVVIFCLPPVRAVTLDVAWLPTAPAFRSCLVTSSGWGRSAIPEYPAARSLGPGC
jgi:hypothetical protein